jgi:hypothetical protein
MKKNLYFFNFNNFRRTNPCTFLASGTVLLADWHRQVPAVNGHPLPDAFRANMDATAQAVAEGWVGHSDIVHAAS